MSAREAANPCGFSIRGCFHADSINSWLEELPVAIKKTPFHNPATAAPTSIYDPEAPREIAMLPTRRSHSPPLLFFVVVVVVVTAAGVVTVRHDDGGREARQNIREGMDDNRQTDTSAFDTWFN